MSHPDLAFVSRRAFLQASSAAVLAARAAPLEALAAAPGKKLSAAGYIVSRLAQHGAGILFGVPGATCDPLFEAAARSSKVVVTSSDLDAGYAADGYARTRGLAALSVTYGVGTMSLLGVIGGAFAERSPIVVVNGGPSALDLKLQKQHQTLFSHSTGREQSDLVMFREVTAFAERARTKDDVPRLVEQALSTALRERRPVYLEIPKDVWDAQVSGSETALAPTPSASGREAALAAQIVERLSQAKRPVLLLGAELVRHGLSEKARALVEKLGIPYVTDLLGKGAVPESTRHFAGVFVGNNSVPAVRALLEKADAILALGCIWGRQARELVTRSQKSLVSAAGGAVRIGSESTAASLGALLDQLGKASWMAKPEHAAQNPLEGLDFAARRKSVPPREPGNKLGYDAVLSTLSDFLDDSFAVVTDTSLSMYPAADLNLPPKSPFICNGVWQAIGFSVAAAIGVALGSGKRPLVVCGDGGFQMTAQALSAMARAGLKSVVVVLDNGLYGIEQFLLEPQYFKSEQHKALPYVALNRWRYADFARALGVAQASTVTTLAELKQALEAARAAQGPVLISVSLPARDLPAQLVKESS